MSPRRSSRRLLVAVAAAGMLALPATAHAQDAVGISPEPQQVAADESTTPQPTHTDEVGIGEPDAVECTGTVTVDVVDVDGAPVAGSVTTVAGEAGTGPVAVACGEVGASLLTPPDGYAPVGETTRVARVTHGATATIQFVVDEVEVLGVSFERDDADGSAAAPPPVSSTADPAAETLPRTGPEDAPRLLLLAGLFAFAGGAFLLVGRESQPA